MSTDISENNRNKQKRSTNFTIIQVNTGFVIITRQVLIINMRTEGLCGIFGLPLIPGSGVVLDTLSACSRRRTFGPLNGV